MAKAVTKVTPKKEAAATKLDTTWHEAFLGQLRLSPNVHYACIVARVSRQSAYRHKELFPDFAEQWEDALQQSVGELEEKVFSRAKLESDTLAIFLLKSHKPEVYADKIEHIVRRMTDEELDAAIAEREEVERRAAAEVDAETGHSDEAEERQPQAPMRKVRKRP